MLTSKSRAKAKRVSRAYGEKRPGFRSSDGNQSGPVERRQRAKGGLKRFGGPTLRFEHDDATGRIRVIKGGVALS